MTNNKNQGTMNKETKIRNIREGEKDYKANDMIGIMNWCRENYDLRKNEVTGVIESRRATTDEPFQQLNENELYVRLKARGNKVTFVDLMALLNSEFVGPYNPFLEYFDHLPKPVAGTIDNYTDYIFTAHQEQFKIHFKKMLVRTIACALEDRVFNKHCFTLVGRQQGTGKSTWCRYLVPKSLASYYTENFSADKDGQIALAQNFIIGLDELHGITKYELNQLKSSFSRDRVSIRHPYARKQTTEPRRASFVASTNEDSFLTDTTGSVRWLCFQVLAISKDTKPGGVNFKNIPIDNVWAEAYQLYKSGFEYELTGMEIRENEQRNEQFQVVTPEMEYCQKYLKQGKLSDMNLFCTATEIKDLINDRTENRADLKSVERIGKALSKLGFERVAKRNELNKIERGYYVIVL